MIEREIERKNASRADLYALCLSLRLRRLLTVLGLCSTFATLSLSLSRPEASTVIQCYSILGATIVLCISSTLSIIPIPAISWPFPPSQVPACARHFLPAVKCFPSTSSTFSASTRLTFSYAYTTGHCLPNAQVPSIVMSDIQRVVKGDPSVNSLSVAPGNAQVNEAPSQNSGALGRLACYCQVL